MCFSSTYMHTIVFMTFTWPAVEELFRENMWRLLFLMLNQQYESSEAIYMSHVLKYCFTYDWCFSCYVYLSERVSLPTCIGFTDLCVWLFVRSWSILTALFIEGSVVVVNVLSQPIQLAWHFKMQFSKYFTHLLFSIINAATVIWGI